MSKGWSCPSSCQDDKSAPSCSYTAASELPAYLFSKPHPNRSFWQWFSVLLLSQKQNFESKVKNYYYYRSWPRLTLKYHLAFNSKILLCAVGEPGMSSNKMMLLIHCWWDLHCEWRLQPWWWRCTEVFRLLNQLKLFASYLIGVRDD